MAQQHPGTGTRVCVTGASGFIGSHVVKQLLERGYTVRGTVRDASNTAKYGWLNKLADGAPGSLELFSADLLHPGSFDLAVSGCEFVCHVAAHVAFSAKDPKAAIVDPALEGTRNVFAAVLKAKAARRVVVTSSIAAVQDAARDSSHTFTEVDWHHGVSLRDPYPMAKTMAERHAWRVFEEQRVRAGRGDDGGWSFGLTTLQPGLVFGPLLHESQRNIGTKILSAVLDGRAPAIPEMHLVIVDVSDVALAHVACLEREAAHGRYILAQEGCTPLVEVARMIKEEFPSWAVTLAPLPGIFVQLLSLFDPDLAATYRLSGKPRSFSRKKAEVELEIQFSPVRDAVISMARSIVQLGIVLPDPAARAPETKQLPAPSFPFSLWTGKAST